MQSIDLIETYIYETSKDLLSKKEEIKCKVIMKQYKKAYFDDVTTQIMKEHNTNQAQIPHQNIINWSY